MGVKSELRESIEECLRTTKYCFGVHMQRKGLMHVCSAEEIMNNGERSERNGIYLMKSHFLHRTQGELRKGVKFFKAVLNAYDTVICTGMAYRGEKKGVDYLAPLRFGNFLDLFDKGRVVFIGSLESFGDGDADDSLKDFNDDTEPVGDGLISLCQEEIGSRWVTPNTPVEYEERREFIAIRLPIACDEEGKFVFTGNLYNQQASRDYLKEVAEKILRVATAPTRDIFNRTEKYEVFHYSNKRAYPHIGSEKLKKVLS